MAQIATLLGAHLNKMLKRQRVNLHIRSDLLVFAGLAHDIGHPPFGHLGEQVLNDKMLDSGGFEGNAQTLRIIARLEKRFSIGNTGGAGEDEIFERLDGNGINPTARSFASVLKYCREIPVKYDDNSNRKITGPVVKGFYASERAIVEQVIASVSQKPMEDIRDFKTIEAEIMDYADDVAYSIYDLEDSFKAGVLRPEDIMGISSDLLRKIAEDVRLKVAKRYNPTANYNELKSIADQYVEAIDGEQVAYLLVQFFAPVDLQTLQGTEGRHAAGVAEYLRHFKNFSLLCSDDQVRRSFTESYIIRCVSESDISVVKDNPPLSRLYVPRDTFILTEILKRVNYYLVIRSNLIRSNERRYERIINDIFDCLYLPGDEFYPRPRDTSGYLLLPEQLQAELDSVFSEHKPSPRNIFERPDDDMQQGDLDIRTLCEESAYSAVPAMKGFSIHQILSHKDYDIRSAVSSAIYRTLANVQGEKYAGSVDKFHKRRLGMKRIVCDYIANMTDRSAQEFYENFIFKE